MIKTPHISELVDAWESDTLDMWVRSGKGWVECGRLPTRLERIQARIYRMATHLYIVVYDKSYAKHNRGGLILRGLAKMRGWLKYR